jgi:hypothetical protein
MPRKVQLGVIEFHSDSLNPGLRQRFFEVVLDLSKAIVDVWLMDIAAVLKEYGYEMTVTSVMEPDNSTVMAPAPSTPNTTKRKPSCGGYI